MPRLAFACVVAAAVVTGARPPLPPTGAVSVRGAEEPVMKSLTPVLLVEEIESCLPFWEELGFSRTIEVPEGDRLGFVAVRSGDVEVMYQSRASLLKDMPSLVPERFDRSGLGLFIQVDDLDAVKAKVTGAPVVFPERTTFYGAREIGVRAPCGTAVTFAQFGEE